MDYTEHYKITKWHDLDNYQCQLCAFATVEGLSAMLDHLHGRHFPTPPPSPILVADKSGREVTPDPKPDPEPQNVGKGKKRGARGAKSSKEN